jgi:hypothetical protein
MISEVLMEADIKIMMFCVWHYVAWQIGTNVLEQPAASLFRVEYPRRL